MLDLDKFEELIQQADQALYHAKKKRNSVSAVTNGE